jgi:hypothetical protein
MEKVTPPPPEVEISILLGKPYQHIDSFSLAILL